ncbi:MAG: formyltransferase family protein [Balneola sp.]
MRLLFIGSVEFSANALKKLIDMNVEIVGVIGKKHSKFNSDFKDVARIAKERDIAHFYTSDINTEEVLDWVKSKKPDVILCFGWSQLIKKDLLNIPPRGIIGFHPAKIPCNRGRHPLIWAVVLGLDSTASTFFKMDEGADTGDILSQVEFPIYKDDYMIDVYSRMTETAINQIEEFIPRFIRNETKVIQQNHKSGNSWRKRGPADGKIDFRMSATSIYNLVRALSKPYIGAHVEYQDQEVKIWSTVPCENYEKNIEPGKVLKVIDGKILVKTGDAAIWLTKHEFNVLPTISDYIL